jgi:hypothetical protein
MGKRSDFDRVPRDYYPTPLAAVEPLIPHLPYAFDYVEPCAGDGRLIVHLTKLTDGHGDCLFACDIEPKANGIFKHNALDLDLGAEDIVDFCITNPPWERKFLHKFIQNWMQVCPTWVLFDCVKIVSVGRVKWIEGSKSQGKDNCAWYLFDYDKKPAVPVEFYGRSP